MKKLFLNILTLLIISSSSALAQITFTMKPDNCRGKDARVISIANLSAPSNTNYGNFHFLEAATWTFGSIGGGTGYIQSFLDFIDLHSIPQGAIITSASLTLYGVSSVDPGTPDNSGENACWIERVSSSWNEGTLTWNTYPGSVTTNRAAIASMNAWNQNRTANVKDLVQDIVNLPSSQRNGFCLKLQNESTFRWITFASSDHPTASLHPKLEVTFTYCGTTSTISTTASARTLSNDSETEYPADKITDSEMESASNKSFPVEVNPNPASNNISVEYTLRDSGTTNINIISLSTGTVIKTLEVHSSFGKNSLQIPIDELSIKENNVLLMITHGDSQVSKRVLIVK